MQGRYHGHATCSQAKARWHLTLHREVAGGGEDASSSELPAQRALSLSEALLPLLLPALASFSLPESVGAELAARRFCSWAAGWQSGVLPPSWIAASQ